MFEGFRSGGIVNRAVAKGLVEVVVHDLRDFAAGRHRQVDDRPYGGDEGMVFKPEPVFAAVESVRASAAASATSATTRSFLTTESTESPVVLLSPQGRVFDGRVAEELARHPQVILICGRYEGVDERVAEALATDEISVGDYVLTGGELAALVVIDAAARFVPGVVGKEESVRHDSFVEGRLDFPHYTRPREFRGMKVPPVLFSGDHAKIDAWRRRKALEKTLERRPDLIAARGLTPEERTIMEPAPKERKKR
jgi:tRNA (guanine37-N1)-methyltransferase